ncbi:unnamed protein product [marine sediment metagenome]|uniref:Uncharacterized protein n=1 Tax=marine sediment metagenome TaxID=412755 RepID=X0WMR1_9ZZZZ
MSLMLPKEHRLKKEKDFERVIRQGESHPGSFLVLKFLRNNLRVSRIGFVVGKKISKKAVARNKLKRRLREAAKAYLPKLKSNYDLIFFSRKGSEKEKFSEIKETIGKLLKKAKLLKND